MWSFTGKGYGIVLGIDPRVSGMPYKHTIQLYPQGTVILVLGTSTP